HAQCVTNNVIVTFHTTDLGGGVTFGAHTMRTLSGLAVIVVLVGRFGARAPEPGQPAPGPAESRSNGTERRLGPSWRCAYPTASGFRNVFAVSRSPQNHTSPESLSRVVIFQRW